MEYERQMKNICISHLSKEITKENIFAEDESILGRKNKNPIL